jgi:putative transcriptional regulator
MYLEIDIDRINLTMLGVKFPTLAALESAAHAIGSNMFEGFEPTSQLVQLYLDWKLGLVSESNLLEALYANAK